MSDREILLRLAFCIFVVTAMGAGVMIYDANDVVHHGFAHARIE